MIWSLIVSECPRECLKFFLMTYILFLLKYLCYRVVVFLKSFWFSIKDVDFQQLYDRFFKSSIMANQKTDPNSKRNWRLWLLVSSMGLAEVIFRQYQLLMSINFDDFNISTSIGKPKKTSACGPNFCRLCRYYNLQKLGPQAVFTIFNNMVFTVNPCPLPKHQKLFKMTMTLAYKAISRL